MEPRTLVLNSWMQPHSIITWQQAVCLVDILRDGRCVLVGKADTLETYEVTVSSPSVTLKIPAVVRLRKDMQTHKKGVKFSRANVMTRDGFRCCYCGERKRPRELNYDHVLPRHRGGKTVWENIASACYKCNGKKRNRTPEEAGMKMHFQPYRPKTLPHVPPIFHLLDEIPEQWEPYVAQLRRVA